MHNIIIEFSKSMDINSFSNKISFIPSIVNYGVNWSEENKKIKISCEDFLYSTQYILTIDSSVTDINGKMLDGNNDGIPGDPFLT